MTQRRTHATGPNPTVLLEVHGDLRLDGGDVNEIVIEGDEADLMPVGADEVHLVTGGDAVVRVPRQAHVTVQGCGGDARLKGLESDLEIKNVSGDLVLRNTVTTTVGQVGGDVSAKRIGGALHLESVGGDISVRDVAGGFSGVAGGDIYLRDVEAEASGTAGGDVVLNTEFAPNHTYTFHAGGDVICRLPAGASATLTATYTGEISMDVPDARTEERDGRKIITLGAGEAQVALDAGGDITLSDVTTGTSGVADSGDDFGNLAETIEARVAERMAEVEKELNAQFGHLNIELSGLAGIDAERIAQRARRAAEAAQRKREEAQRKVQAAQRKAEAYQRKAERTGRRRSWGFNFTFPTPPTPPTSPTAPTPPRAPMGFVRPQTPLNDPVSDEERMAILRLVEQGKITAADAEKLLAALEGK